MSERTPASRDGAMNLSRLSYAVVDVETTGGSPRSGHRITEIAVVVVREGRIGEIYEQIVNPDRPIPPFITQLTGISDRMVHGAPRFADIVPDLVTALAGNVFVAHNAGFDWGFVSAELERAVGRTPTALTLCTVRMARLLLPQLPRKSLDYVAHCLMRLIDDAADRGFTTLEEVQRAGRRRTTRRRWSATPGSTLDDRTA